LTRALTTSFIGYITYNIGYLLISQYKNAKKIAPNLGVTRDEIKCSKLGNMGIASTVGTCLIQHLSGKEFVSLAFISTGSKKILKQA